VTDEYRAQLIDLILRSNQGSEGTRGHEQAAWLGDISGHEFLFRVPEFRELFVQIAEKIRSYTDSLGINTELINFAFQRSWATVTRQGERISEHAHEQSNISFAYYLKKPPGSGAINFITEDHPNEFSRGIFTPTKQDLGFIKTPSPMTWNLMTIEADQDDILIFPSKTLHSTVPNQSEEARISISADVVTMLRDSQGHETMMPDIKHWQSLDEF